MASNIDDPMDVEILKVKSPKASTNNLPWVEKYRPKDLDDLVSHEAIISTLNRLIDSNKLPHLLFYGPPGTGKTSMILAAAKRLFGSNFRSMVLELNASDDRGIDIVRNQIKEFAGTKKLFSTGVKLVILDEADAMTNDAQFSLRRVIEKYTRNTRFCLICNYVSKIIPALQSRCTRFRFAPLTQDQVKSRVRQIATEENLKITECGFDAVLRLSEGDMRRILNILQATSMACNEINEQNVYLCTGNPLPEDIERIVTLLMNEPFNVAYKEIFQLQKSKGYAINDLVTNIYNFVVGIELPSEARIYLIDELAQLELRLAFATSEQVQLGALISIFSHCRQLLASP